MKIKDHSMTTFEEREIRRLWMQRPACNRKPADLSQFEQWLLSRRPELLPKGADDAFEYLARLLADCVDSEALLEA